MFIMIERASHFCLVKLSNSDKVNFTYFLFLLLQFSDKFLKFFYGYFSILKYKNLIY